MKVVLWFLMMFMPLMANASSVNEEQLFHRLDSYIAQRSKFTQRKEAKLLRLKKQLHMTSDKHNQLRLYNQIYREYYTYRYDSAMTYAKKGYQLAVQLQDDYFINLNKINRAAVLSTGGFYSQAEDLMLAMDVEIRKNRIVTASLVIVSILSLGFLAMAFFAFKMNKRLAKSRREIKSQNTLLDELNQKLLNTNKRRETYMHLFMDISAVYIKKLDDYRKLVSRKIKAKQTADLLTAINSYKLAEEEAANFYIRFDKAFIDLYPNFVEEFNQLLLPEKQIVLPAPNSLTKELRIYALMRLGITDGQELATLLFYSTQTIYNYKAAIRKRAKDLTSFDAAINRLCNVIG